MTPPKLTTQPLGRTGIDVAKLSLGTVKLGRAEGVKYPTAVIIPSDREARALFALARDLGINLIDTAPAYGTSETRLGELLDAGWRVCTKVGEEFVEGESTYDFTPEHVNASVERSLRRLKRDVLDVVLIHSDGRDEEILKRFGTLDALNELKRAGKIGATGISHKTVAGGLLAIEREADVLMTTLNRDDDSQLPVIEAAAGAGVGVMIKKALASGHRADKDAPRDLKWIAGMRGVSTIVVGTANPKHLAENVSSILR